MEPLYDPALWLPFTANRHFSAFPRSVKAAHGMYYTRHDGKAVLDATSGLWCVNAGHGRKAIARAIAEAARELDYAPAFQMGHPRAFRLARRLVELMPKGLDHVMLTNSGSEAVDSALKLALAWRMARGESRRRILIGRKLDYHGAGLGGLAVGGLPANSAPFPNLPPLVDHMKPAYDHAQDAFSRGLPPPHPERAEDLLRLVRRHGAEAIAAVILEPVAGSAGVLPPPDGYLEHVAAICRDNGITLIWDEVITAFGRLGKSSAAARFGITPDILVLAKGITNGAAPMGAVMATAPIMEPFLHTTAPELAIELPHGFTTSGHPLAAAAALAALDIYEGEGLFERAASLAPVFEDAVHTLRAKPNVIDIRNIGLMAAIELAPDEEPLRRAFSVYRRCFEDGLLIRSTGDTIALSPPLIAEEKHIRTAVAVLGRALDATP